MFMKLPRPMLRKSLLSVYLLLLFFSLSQIAAAQNKAITGRVTDAQGQGIAGISVTVKGTARGTVTDDNGYYKIQATRGDVLVISGASYTEQLLPVRGATADISLTEDAKQLTDVVVIGYGQKSRRLLTESISTVSAKEIQKLPVASADAAIQGKVSGVQISNADGSPGSPVAIRVRGVSTVGTAQPLFVIDGIPVGNTSGQATNPLSTINPSDIENISVLKDASSAAIYGMRAANGVVLITTKRGKSGKPRVGLDAYYGIQQFPKRLDVLNTAQYVELGQEAVDARNAQLGLQPGDPDYKLLHPDLLAGTPNSVLGRDVDWQEPTINKNAPVANYNASVSGGTENAKYFFSVGGFNQQSTVKRWDLERYSVRVNSDFNIGSRLKIGQTLALSFQEVKRGVNASGDGYLYANDLSMPPFFQIYDVDKSIPGNRYGFNGNSQVAGLTIGNALGQNEIVWNREHVYRLIGGLYAELEIIKGLKYRSAASIDLSFNRFNRWSPGFTAAEMGFGREINQFEDNRSQGYTQVFTNTLNYDKSFGNHSFNLLAGIEYQKLRNNGMWYIGRNFQSVDPGFYEVVSNGRGSSNGFDNISANAGNSAYASYFGRLSYNYLEKYLVTATFRRDGTSRFAPDYRFGNFPSVSAAWRISEEPFFPESGVVSDLKLRGSYGELGNALTSEFAYISRVAFVAQYPLNGAVLQAPMRPALPNESIGWETVQSTDFGFDVSLFNNRVSLLATYYVRNTKNFLYSLPVAFTSGFGSADVNLGDVSNKGFEFDLGYNTMIAKKVNFNVSANLTTVKNRLVNLAPGVEEYSSGDYRTAIGFPIGYFYGYQTDGIYQTDEAAANALPDPVAGNGAYNRPRAGDVIFRDVNSPMATNPAGKKFADTLDGQITAADRTYLGKTIPDFFYGLNINAGFRNFDLSIFFQGVSGIQVYNELKRNMQYLGAPGRNQLATVLGRWTGEGSSNSMPRAIDGDPYQNNRFSDRYVEDAGFLRLKNLQIGYTFSDKFLARSHSFQSARIYLGATNLFVITDYSGLDPEVITYGTVANALTSGTDAGNTPQPRTFQAGVQFSF